jgi:hypothetical protein
MPELKPSRSDLGSGLVPSNHQACRMRRGTRANLNAKPRQLTEVRLGDDNSDGLGI